MAFRLYVSFIILFFVSCGELENTRKSRELMNSSYLAQLKKHPFSPQEEAALLKSWSSLKLLDYKKYATSKELAEMVEDKLHHNERHERALYRAYLPHKNLDEVTRKYQILRRVGFTDPESIPHPRVLDAVVEAYRDFGDLYIGPSHSGVEYEADQIPWAGHWYPFAEDTLYKDENAPLGKLDLLIKKIKNQDAGIREYHKIKSDRLKGTSWNGLCDGRSFASVAKMEPRLGETVKGIYFSPADLKGILTVAHSGFSPESGSEVVQYGTTYSRSFETDGTYQDVSPIVMHKVAEEIIGKKRESLVVNETIGQVWNAPMYAYEYSVQEDKNNSNAFLVNASPRLVAYRPKETDEPTSRRDMEMKEYNYRFYVDKQDKIFEKEGYENPQKGKKMKIIQKFRVIAGEWIGDSIVDHPDNVKVVSIGRGYSTTNEPLKKHLDVLELLFKR